MNLTAPTGAVTVEVPADYSYLRVLRLTVSSLAADLSFDIDEIESARSAVDELASILIGSSDPRHGLVVSIHRVDDRIEVAGHVEVFGGRPAPDPLVASVLDASTTSWSCGLTEDVAHFDFTCVRGAIGLRRR